MEETDSIPGVAVDGISSDIFGTPSGAAWDAAKLIFGDWLELVFNDVGGGSATIMTHVAGYVNFLAYVLISVIMSYVLIASVIKTASEGKIMGNGWSTVWLPLRTFLACFLIFPVGIGQASTISFIQVAVAWLGMVGSNAADRVASFVVENLTKRVFKISTQVQGYQVISDMTKLGFCASGFNKGIKDSYPRPDNVSLGGLYGRVNISETLNGVASRQLPVDIKIDSSLSEYTRVEVGHKGHCGELIRPRIDIRGEYDEEFSNKAFEIVLNHQVQVYNDIVEGLDNYNYATYMSYLTGSGSTTNGASDARNEVEGAIASFFSLVDSYEKEMSNLFLEASSQSDETSGPLVSYSIINDGNFVVNINKERYSDLGWAYLGAYYTLLSKAIGEVTEIAKAVTTVSSFNNPDGCTYAQEDVWSKIGSWFQSWGEDDEVCIYSSEFDKNEIVLEGASFAMGASSVNDDGKNINKLSSACSSIKNCSLDLVEKAFASSIGKAFFEYEDYFGATDEGTNNYARNFISILGWGNSSIMGISELDTEDGSSVIAPGALYISDPITFTSNLGHNIVYAVSTARITLGFFEGLAEGGKNSGVPVVGAVSAFLGGVLEALVSFLKVIIGLIYPQAAAMAYFLPLLPSLIWAMAFLSWLLMYAEAIFNAPLAVTLMATPEGEGIAGSRMERKIAMLAALILKPTFLIVGLLLSMMILSIGFVFLNQVFWMAAANVTWRVDPIAVVALISIWFSIITVFMHNTFKIIPTFADNSLEWFLGGIARAFGNDLDNVTSDQFTNSFTGANELSTGAGKSVGIFAKGAYNDATGKRSANKGSIGKDNSNSGSE